MAVISISIIKSPIQKVEGIPTNITVETSVPATVFYTLDGTDPTLMSNIAVGPIALPTNINTVTFKAFATDGIISCPIITELYGPKWERDRFPRDKVIGLCAQPLPVENNRAFGVMSPNPNVTYGGIGGITVDAPNTVGIPDGYDGTGTGTAANETDLPYNRQFYNIKYSTTNFLGESGHGIGNLPAQVTIGSVERINNSNDANSKLFNPKSMVIIQDGREEPEDPNVVLLNRQFFRLGDQQNIRDGVPLSTTGFEGSGPTGSFVRRAFNPRENTWTFYYRDNERGHWIISIEPMSTSINGPAMSQLAFAPKTFAEKKVFQWIPFKRQISR